MIVGEGNQVTAGTTYAALVTGSTVFVGRIWAEVLSQVDIKFISGNVVTLDGTKNEGFDVRSPIDLSQLQVRGKAGISGQILKYAGSISQPSAQLANNL
jgi:hypothetical protein